MYIKYLLLSLIFTMFFVGCSTVEMITKKNNLNIENYPEGIINLYLKDGQIIEFNKKENIKYKLYGDAVIILENNEVKEQIQLTDIKYYQVSKSEEKSLFSNGYFFGFIVAPLVIILFILALPPIRFG